MLIQILTSSIWQTVGVLIGIISAAIGFIKSQRSHRAKVIWTALLVFGIFLLITSVVGIIMKTTPENKDTTYTPSTPGISTPTKGSLSPTTSITATPTMISNATPTSTSVVNANAVPTATSLPTGAADCKGGQNVGWDKWTSNPQGGWIKNGATIVNTEDTTGGLTPSLTGSACGLLKIGSRITISFKMGNSDGILYLLAQGTDDNWYGIQFNWNGANIIKKGQIVPFASGTGATLKQGNTYRFTMEIATDGNINLVGTNLSYGAAFVPNGQWGLKTHYGTFVINSISAA